MKMKYSLLFTLVFLGGVFHTALAQDTQLGTTRSDDLQIKARMEYERRNQKQLQSHTTQTQNKSQVNTPAQKVEAATQSGGTPAAPPMPSVSGPQKSLSCKNGNEMRELYIEYKGQGCELFYTKSGATKSQARQNNGKSVCESVFEKMKSTIEKSGYTCEQKEN